ncbi:MAG TPA: IclR family transcriptional regulator [Candidatus Angelobacter sp.]|nr:IclR family transcriptional regulator [Candidatus Angelobacter sp.]
MADRDLRPVGDTQVLASVSNAARLLKEFGKGDREIGVSELARRLGLGKSTTHRLLHTLTVERLLEQDPETGSYRLALAMHELGASVQASMDLHTAASPVIEQLRNMTKETIQIAVLDGRHVVYVERRESPQTIRLFGRVGHRNDAHATSTGKVLLAFLPADELDALLVGWRLPRKTPYTISDQETLRRQLATIRAQGWAENVNESEVGVASVSAPIRDVRGVVVAALSIAGPVQRLDGANLRRFTRPAVEAAAAISRRLGWSEPATRTEGAR